MAVSDIHQKWKNRVRPNVNETLANEEDMESNEGDEGELEEARPIAGQKAIYKPTIEEWDNHMRTHIPFRRWCPFCVKGKCKSNPHWQKSKSEEELERETRVISFDYMEPKSKDGKTEKIDSLRIIVGSDRKSKWKIAHMVARKGHDPHAIKIIAREIRIAGYSKMVLKSDQEPAIREFLDAVKRENRGHRHHAGGIAGRRTQIKRRSREHRASYPEPVEDA